YDGEVWHIAFSSNGEILATGGNQSIKLWNVKTGELIQSFSDDDSVTMHKILSQVPDFFVRKGYSLKSVSADRKLQAVAMQSGKVNLLDVQTGRELASLIALDENDWMVVTPDGLFDGSPAAWNKIIWRFNDNT